MGEWVSMVVLEPYYSLIAVPISHSVKGQCTQIAYFGLKVSTWRLLS